MDPIFWISRFVTSKVAVATALGAALLGGYQVLRPATGKEDLLRHSLAEKVAERALAELPARYNGRVVAVLPIENDPGGWLASALRTHIKDADTWRQLPADLERRYLAEAPAPVSSVAKAAAAARVLGVDAVIMGIADQYAAGPDGAHIRFGLRVVDRESGQAVSARVYTEAAEGGWASPSWWGLRMSGVPAVWRLLLWLSLAVLMPVASAPLIVRVAATESNLANVLVLAALTLADAVIAAGLLSFRLQNPWVAGFVIAAAIVCSYYNYRAATLIDELAR